MGKYRRRRRGGGTLTLKKTDHSLRKRVRELGGDRVGVVPIDVSKERICAMVADFYGNILRPPCEYVVTTTGLRALERVVDQARAEHGLELVVIGLEQTGRLHRPVELFLRRRWQVKLVHPLVTNHLRQGISQSTKTEAMDLDALMRAITGCYGLSPPALPVAFQRWRAIHRAREQLVGERSALKQRMNERLHAALPGFSKCFESLWSSPTAIAVMQQFDSPAKLLHDRADGLWQRLRELGVRCTKAKAESLVAWAADAPPTAPAATTEAAILRGDLDHFAFLTGRIEHCERNMLGFLVQTPFVLLLSVSGISHVLASGIGAEAGPMELYPTGKTVSGRAGLYGRRYQSDTTDLQGGMAHGAPFMRDALMKAARCTIMPQGAFHAWGEPRRTLGWDEKKIVAAMANRLCGIIHTMLLKAETFRHPDAKPGMSVLGKLLNVAADLGLEAPQVTKLAADAAEHIPAHSLPLEIRDLQTGAWKNSHRPREHGASRGTTRQISRNTVPKLIERLQEKETNHALSTSTHFRSP